MQIPRKYIAALAEQELTLQEEVAVEYLLMLALQILQDEGEEDAVLLVIQKPSVGLTAKLVF